DLDIGGIDASQLRWTVNTIGSIRATVSWRRPLTGTFTSPDGHTVQADMWITDKSKNVTRVTLTGPRASSSPGSLTRPFLPQTFELVGRDSSGNEVRYGFVLRQWFVNRGGKVDYARDQTEWCRSLGYSMPRVRDLTNAVCSGWNSNSYCQGAVGATPSSGNNAYQRRIGAGFFTEWGYLYYYADAGFDYYYYWTSDDAGSYQFGVYPYDGNVFSLSASSSRSGLCTAP
ncbi:MAG: hypothetical protein J6563_06920, partial [Gilliamella sp.]|uniref:hypothetical protein n=1 Tax=Gilliamella sp. TaxID=1891236 RepID=UPI002638AB4A